MIIAEKDVVYEGEWIEGEWGGTGKCTYANGDVFKGEFKNNSIVRGIEHYMNGDKYKGQLEYSTERKEDLKHGLGTYTYADGEQYEGQFRNDKVDGYGTSNHTIMEIGTEEGGGRI